LLSDLLLLGPLNGLVLLAALVGGLGISWVSVLRLRQGEPVRLMPIVLVVAAPLLFAVYAVTFQFWDSTETVAAASPAARQMVLAQLLSRAVYTQIAAGVIAVLPALIVIGGCLSIASLGERPRSGIAIVASLLTLLLTATALASGAASGAWGLSAIRAMLYLIAGGAITAALLSTHQRGPGAQVGPIAAATLPLLVAAIDTGASGWLSMEQFILIARAPALEKQAILATMVQSITTLRLYSGVTLSLALALAALGPLASAYRSRTLINAQIIAIVTSMIFAAVVVRYGCSFLVPFTDLVS